MSLVHMTSQRGLLIAWVVLMTSTLLTMWAGQAASTFALTHLGAGALLGLAGLKGLLILWSYLQLGRSTKGWKIGFVAFLSALLLVIMAAYLLAPMVSA